MAFFQTRRQNRSRKLPLETLLTDLEERFLLELQMSAVRLRCVSPTSGLPADVNYIIESTMLKALNRFLQKQD